MIDSETDWRGIIDCLPVVPKHCWGVAAAKEGLCWVDLPFRNTVGMFCSLERAEEDSSGVIHIHSSSKSLLDQAVAHDPFCLLKNKVL